MRVRDYLDEALPYVARVKRVEVVKSIDFGLNSLVSFYANYGIRVTACIRVIVLTRGVASRLIRKNV